MAAKSSSVKSKSKTSKFSEMRWGFVDLGMTERPSCRRQRSIIWVGDWPWLSAIAPITGSSSGTS